MLKITIHDSAAECRFQLTGALAGTPVRELALSWETARSTTRGRRTTLDLRGLTEVDAEGQALLDAMFEAGVTLAEPAVKTARTARWRCNAGVLVPCLLLLGAVLQPLG